MITPYVPLVLRENLEKVSKPRHRKSVGNEFVSARLGRVGQKCRLLAVGPTCRRHVGDFASQDFEFNTICFALTGNLRLLYTLINVRRWKKFHFISILIIIIIADVILDRQNGHDHLLPPLSLLDLILSECQIKVVQNKFAIQANKYATIFGIVLLRCLAERVQCPKMLIG